VTRPALAPNKALGQHFLHDAGVLDRIAALAAPEPGSGVVEIGPGTGNLTAHLIARLPRAVDSPLPLVLVELDRRVPAALTARFAPLQPSDGRPFCRIELADAAAVDWPALLADPALGPTPVVAGNLPYNAAMPILFSLMDLATPPQRMVFMVQREVADRLVAGPSHPDRGQISVKVQLRAAVRIALKVGRGAFQPPPRVDSAVVVVEPPLAPVLNLPAWPTMARIVTAGFAVRRKTLANALRMGGFAGSAIETALADAEVSALVRAEALTLEQWAALGRSLAGQVEGSARAGDDCPAAPHPAHSPPARRGPPRARTMTRSNGLSVLVAEDDYEIADMLRKTLAQAGYTVTVACDGEEALAAAMANRPDLVVLDVMMPAINGWEVCKALRARPEFAEVGILMLTAIGPNLNEMTAPLYGADDFLDKPFLVEDLLDKLAKLPVVARAARRHRLDREAKGDG